MESEWPDPVSAMGEVDQVRAQMSERVASPWWFHVGLGLLVAQQAFVSGMVVGLWTAVSFVVLIAGAAVLVALARRSTGITVALPRGPRSRGVMTARFVAALACIWGAALVANSTLVVVLTVVAFVVTVVLGLVYDHALGDDVANASRRP